MLKFVGYASAVFCSIASASAQWAAAPTADYFTGYWGLQAPSELGIADLSRQNGFAAPTPRADDGKAELTNAAPSSVTPSDLRFSPDKDARRASVRTLADQIAEASPENADVLRDADLFREMNRALRSYGMTVNSLPDASVVYLTELWDAANMRESSLGRREAKSLRDQLERAYIAIGHPGLKDAEQVQAQADQFILQGWLIGSLRRSFDEPNISDADRAAFQSAMRDLGQEVFGIDLTRATIDERGLTPGEALGTLDRTVRDERAKRAAADPAGEADRAVEAALGTACGHAPSDATERKVLRLFETRGLCAQYDPARYDAFEAEVPIRQRYAINFMAWSTGKPLYPADQAKVMDGMIE